MVTFGGISYELKNQHEFVFYLFRAAQKTVLGVGCNILDTKCSNAYLHRITVMIESAAKRFFFRCIH